MNYAFMSFSCPDLSLDEMLALAQRLGYAGIEPRAGSNHAHGVELEAGANQRATIKAKATATGVALCCLATSCRYADPATVEAQVAETHQFIDLAGDIGSPRLRVFGGKLGEGLSREAAIDQVAHALDAVANHAAERQVTICLETHDDWCDPTHVAAVMQQVDHPHIAVNWDIMHPIRAGGSTMEQAFETLQTWIQHVHFHDGSDSTDKLMMLPVGEGVYDHKRALELLKASGYTGYLSGEWIGWEPYETHLPRELATMQSYEQALG